MAPPVESLANTPEYLQPLPPIFTIDHDALKRLIRTTYADGSQVSNSYDAAGWLTAITDARGNIPPASPTPSAARPATPTTSSATN